MKHITSYTSFPSRSVRKYLNESSGRSHDLKSAEEGFKGKGYVSLGILSLGTRRVSEDPEGEYSAPGSTPEKFTELSDGWGVFWNENRKYYYTLQITDDNREELAEYVASRKVKSPDIELPDDYTTTIESLCDELKPYVDRGFIVEVSSIGRWGPLAGYYSRNFTINQKRILANDKDIEITLDQLDQALRLYVEDSGRIRVCFTRIIRNNIHIFPKINLDFGRLSWNKTTNMLLGKNNTQNIDVTVENMPKIMRFIKNRPVTMDFAGSYTSVHDSMTAEEAVRQLRTWTKLKPVKAFISREVANPLISEPVTPYCRIRVTCDPDLMTPEQRKSYDSRMDNVGREMEKIYGRGGGTWTGD